MRVVEGRLLGVGLSVAALLCMAMLGASAVGAHRAGHAPDIIQLSYSESSGDVGPDRRLEAFARHTHGMHFATTYKGRRAKSPGRYHSEVTDTDIHGRKARHPWEPDRREGGQAIIRLVHKSLHQRGFANVRLRARKSGEVDKERVRVDLDDNCVSAPLYPVDCEVKVN
jgi:hypothetical protein